MRPTGERFDTLSAWFVKYQPFITLVVAILLIAVVLPGRSDPTSAPSEQFSELAAGAPEFSLQTDPVATDDVEVAGSQTTSGGTESTATGGPDPGTEDTATPLTTDADTPLVENCDPATGRIAIPTRFAPICVPRFEPPNAGATWQGVTEDTIVIAVYESEDNPAAEAILAAAGADDSEEEVRQQYREWVEFYETHTNTWGRTVELHFVPASGPQEDDAAGKADAIRIAEEIGAFAVWGPEAPSLTYVSELVARGVLCFCTTSQPIEAYEKWEPYVWTTLMASSQGYVHRAEMVGKRLAGKQAAYAYDDIAPTQTYREMERRLALLYYETPDFAYKAGADFFVKHLRDRYGVELTIPPVQYNGYPNIAATQEQARPIIQKMKENDITSIVCACDPFAPIFFTQEATRQLYGPEWIITGSALTDTSFFARLYDQDQWEHAFGISFLTARLPEEFSESFRLFRWQFDKEPTARAGYGVIRGPVDQFFNGLHLTGPSLTPESFRDGMYSMPITGRGGITTITNAYGDKGIWPWATDTLAFDDITYIWWDRTAEGEDEIGQEGQGLYRYVDMGQRYLPTEHPSTPIPVWDEEGTVTIYEEPPPQDRWPCYPSPATGKTDRC